MQGFGLGHIPLAMDTSLELYELLFPNVQNGDKYSFLAGYTEK